jgi:hypothetical protein
VAAATPSASAAAPAPIDPRTRLSASAVLAAASAVRADPDFGGSRKDWEWRLKRQDSDSSSKAPTIPGWVRSLAGWLAEGGRVVVWIAAAIAVALLIVGARHWLRVRGDALATSRRKLPTHVGTLDIRPESLPDDLAGAAGGLWQRGDRRGALALLYRGALSRLVHAHGVAIESSSTEAEVVVLARKRLPAGRGDFVARLVAAWTLASWGGRLADEATFESLRADFDRALPRTADEAPGLGPSGAAARAAGGGRGPAAAA